MDERKDYEKVFEFTDKLKNNELKTPNDFTIEMGKLIREAREVLSLSQSELAKKTNKRPATISDIENGKSDISVLTIVSFALALHKPISYFFPQSLLMDYLLDISTPFEYKMIEKARSIQNFGDPDLTLDLIDVLIKHFSLAEDIAMGYTHPEEE